MTSKVIRTEDPHIVITEFRESDLDRLALLLNDVSVYNNTLTIPNPYRRTDAEKFFEGVRKFESLNGYQKDWVIRKDGDLIGGIGLLYNHGLDAHRSEFGYWLGEDYRGKGYMTICVKAFIDFVFSSTRLVRIEGHAFKDNIGSCRVLEKSGFEKEGYLRKIVEKNGEYLDAHLYALIR